MFRSQCVLPLVALFLGFVHSWDLAVSRGKRIEFYTNDKKTDTITFDSHTPGALAYDEVHNMVLFVSKELNNDTICGHDLTSKENTCFIERNGRNIHGIAFDPTTLLLYFTDVNERSINFVSLKGRGNKYGNLLIKMDHGIPTDIAVESCRGYIYWINTNLDTPTIERAKLGGLERQVFIYSQSIFVNTTYKREPHSLSIDQRTRKIFWIEPQKINDSSRVYYSDLNYENNNKYFLYNLVFSNFNPSFSTLAVSKTTLFFAYYHLDDENIDCIYKFSKFQYQKYNYFTLPPKNDINGIVANYSMKEQIWSIHDCPALTYININERNNFCDGPFSDHGTGLLGHPGQRCEISTCENYCIRGSCRVNKKGLPKCSCKAGFSGKRCEVELCHGYCLNSGNCSLNNNSEPVCQCKEGYAGDRCEESGCFNYCIKGNCSFNDDGVPQCSCDAGYSGVRCEVNDCDGYCLNDGICFLNEKGEATCECIGNFVGSRCEAGQSITITLPSTSSYSVEANRTLTDLPTSWRTAKALITVIVDEP